MLASSCTTKITTIAFMYLSILIRLFAGKVKNNTTH